MLCNVVTVEHFSRGNESLLRGLARYAAFDILQWNTHDARLLPEAVDAVDERFEMEQVDAVALRGELWTYHRKREIEDKAERLEDSWNTVKACLAQEEDASPLLPLGEPQAWPAEVERRLRRNHPHIQEAYHIGCAMIEADYKGIGRAGPTDTEALASHFREGVLKNRSTGISAFNFLFHSIYTLAASRYFSEPLRELAHAWEYRNTENTFYPLSFINDRRLAPHTPRKQRLVAQNEGRWTAAFGTDGSGV